MPVATLKDVADQDFTEPYGVPAINIVNDLTLVQTSVKTVKSLGSSVLASMWASLTAGREGLRYRL